MKLLFSNGTRGEHAPSWYQATCDTPHYPSLEQDIQCDVCVVGAGFTGLSAALHLQALGYSVVVLDAHRVAWGASGRNGGQLGSGFTWDQFELEQHFGHEYAHAMWRFCESAKQTVHSLCKDHNIDVHYKSGIINAKHRARFVADAHRYCEKLKNDYHYPNLQPLTQSELAQLVDSPNYFGGAIDHGAGHIHPLRLGLGLAKVAASNGASIYEQSCVTSIEHTDAQTHRVRTDKACVQANCVVLACNGYLDGLEPVVQQRVMPINNFIVATEPLGALADELLSGDHAVYDSRFVVNYFRLSHDKRLLFGGGETYGYAFPDNIADLVRKPMLQVFPQLHNTNIDYAWGGTLAITRSRLPFVRMIKPNLYSASGYSGHGVALAVESGKAVAHAINGDSTEFEQLNRLECARFPGGDTTRSLLLKAAMTWYALRDKF